MVSSGMSARKMAVLAASVLGILVAYWLLAVSAVSQKCTAFDEIAHLTAGYSYWLTEDFRLQPENGNLPQRLGAVPLAFSSPDFPNLDNPDWQQSNVWLLGYEFFYGVGNDPDELLLRARAMMAVLGVMVGLLVLFWSWRLFGLAGAFVSLVACVFCPSMLAHGPLVTSDMAVTFFFLAAVAAWWRMLHRLTLGSFLLSALSLAGLFLSKFSAVLFVPMALLMVLVRLYGRQPWTIALPGVRSTLVSVGKQSLCVTGVLVGQIVLVWLAIWSAYDFRYDVFAENQAGHELHLDGWDYVMPKSGSMSAILQTARDLHVLPEAYLYGFAFTLRFVERNAFFNGEFGTQGWFWFFPYALLVKTPVPLFVLLACAALAVRRRWQEAEPSSPRKALAWQSFYAAAPLWILFSVYWIAALQSKLNIGHRHILPTYPVLFIFAGAAGYWLRLRPPPRETDQPATRTSPLRARPLHPVGAAITVTALILLAVESARTYPNYLAYFNQIAGGPSQGYRHLVDSSLDWGQDLPALKQWLDEHDPGREVPAYLSYFGTGSPKYYGVGTRMLPSFFDFRGTFAPAEWQPGIYCISASMLQGVYSAFPGQWNREYEVAYRRALKLVEAFKDAKGQPDKENEQLAKIDWPVVFRDYDNLRFGRLCRYLRPRQPDAQVGFSILIYRLTADDLRAALGTQRALSATSLLKR